jgi:hypothetical protein
VQKPQLHNVEEQEEAHRADGNEEVLQHVPQANGAQGSEVSISFSEKSFSQGSFLQGRRTGRF